MNLSDAAYATAHDYPGGTESLAPRLGMSGAILRGKVNLNDKSHHLTLSEAMRMQAITNDPRILHAMAEELGFVCIQTPAAMPSDMAMLDSFMEVAQRLGEFSREFREDYSDGNIDGSELAVLEDDCYQMQQAMMVLMQRIRSLAEQGTSHG